MPAKEARPYGIATAGLISQWTEGTLWGRHGEDEPITHVYYDTRRILKGENGLFVALQGRHDGHDYIEEAFRKGVRVFLVSNRARLRSLPAHIQTRALFIVVKDTLRALQQWARHHRKTFEAPVIAITGSNGKTIVKEWLYHLLAPFRSTYRSPGSYNSQLGVPLSILKVRPDHATAILEAGISRPGEMTTLSQIIRPNGVIFTTLGSAHDAHFQSREQKLQEKLLLAADADWLIFRSDQPYSPVIEAFLRQQGGKPVRWAVHDAPADYRIILQQRKDNATNVRIIPPAGKEVNLTLPFRHTHHIENALHAIVAAHHVGLSFDRIRKMLSTLPPVRMRLEVERAAHDNLIINDAYNSDLESLRAAVEFTRPYVTDRPAILVLSDFEESHPSFEEIKAAIHPIDWEHIYYVGHGATGAFPWPTTRYPDTESLIRALSQNPLPEHRVWLLKGARRFHVEKVASFLRQRSHRTRLEVNLAALAHNFYLYRSLLPPQTGIILMVKAFAYGTGIGQLTRFLNELPVAYLAVAYVDEGIALREAGVKQPIMVMHVAEQEVASLKRHHLEPVLYAFPLWEELHRQGYEGKVHIKVDTGMRRMGFEEEAQEKVARAIRQWPEIRPVSIFTHLAAAEDPAHDAFTHAQLRQFEAWTRNLEQRTGRTFLRHALNSAGMIRFGHQYRYEMVRLGIGLLGVDPTGLVQSRLEPALSLKTTVLQLREITPEDTIGYGRRGRREHRGTIAVIGAGYADGYRRILSEGRGKVNINNCLYPTIGTISMDVTAIDVSGGDVAVGDEVTLFGEFPPLSAVARWMGTIPYEVIVGIPERVRRVYFQDAL